MKIYFKTLHNIKINSSHRFYKTESQNFVDPRFSKTLVYELNPLLKIQTYIKHQLPNPQV